MASGDAKTGVIQVGPGIIRPYPASGPFKTQAQAEVCCGPFITEADLGLDGLTDCTRVCSFNVRRYVKTVVRQAGTGHIVTESPRLDLLNAWTSASLTYPLCCGYFLAGSVSGTIPTCPANPTDIVATYGAFREIIGADTFSTPTVHIGIAGTRFLTISSLVVEAGWTMTGAGVGVPIAKRSVCGLSDFLRAPTKVASFTNTPFAPDGSCAAIDLELWIEPA